MPTLQLLLRVWETLVDNIDNFAFISFRNIFIINERMHILLYYWSCTIFKIPLLTYQNNTSAFSYWEQLFV